MSTQLFLTSLCFFAFVSSYIISSISCSDLSKIGHRIGIGIAETIHLNSSSVEIGALEFDGVNDTNSFSICRVIGNVAYGAKANNTLNFELWLPERSSYNGRYLSVGTTCSSKRYLYRSKANTGKAMEGSREPSTMAQC